MVDYAFCLETPEWPGCKEIIADHEAAQEAEKADAGMGGDDDMMKDMDGADPMMGQMTYTLTALLGAANVGLTLYRYNKETNNDVSAYDNVWGDQNWIEIYRMILNYT